MGQRRLIILGTGGNCVDILEAALEINARGTAVYEPLGFLDDNPELWGKAVSGLPVLGGLDKAKEFPDALFINGIGSPKSYREKEGIIARTGIPLERFETVIHPQASVSKSAVLGRGVAVLANATIASNARVGDHVIVLPGVVISHDDEIGAYTCVASGAAVSGGVKVGRSCYLGCNCSVIGEVSIGDGALVGMGAVVIRDVQAGAVVVGNPARLLK